MVEVHYAKAGPHDILMSVQVTNAGPEADTLHVLPTAWFRNTWSWDFDAPKPELAANGPASVGRPPPVPRRARADRAGRPRAGRRRRCCSVKTRPTSSRLYGVTASPAYPKDGINDHVISGAATVNPELRGTKCAFWYQVTVQPGATVDLHLRLRPKGAKPAAPEALGSDFDKVMAQRLAEADEFYTELTPTGGLG